MTVDLHTFVIILIFIHLLEVFVILHFYRNTKNYAGIGWWLLWSISESLGFGFMLFRNILPILPAVIIIQNTLLVSGTVFLYVGVKKFFGRPVNLKLILPVLSLFFTGLLFFLFIRNDIQVRSALISISLAIISFSIAISMVKDKCSFTKTRMNFNAALFLGQGLFFVYRSLMIASGTHTEDFFEPTLFNILTGFDVLIVSLLWTFGLVILINRRMNSEILEEREVIVEGDLKFRSLFENMVEGVAIHEMIYGPDGNPVDYRIVDVNKAFELQTGISAGQALGALAGSLYGESKPPYLEIYNDVVVNNLPFYFETHFKGLKKDFGISVISPKPGFFATIFLDITERKRNEHEISKLLGASERSRYALLSILEDQKLSQESLRESEEKFSAAFRTAQNAVAITRDNGMFTEANDAFTEMTGYTRDEAIHNNSVALRMWVHREDSESVLKTLNAGGSIVSREYQFRKKDGKVITGLFSASLIHIKNKPYYLSSINDITQRKQAEEKILRLNEELERRVADRTRKLQESYKELETFSYTVSHDLRAPLRYINGYVELLSKSLGEALPEKSRHYLGTISDSANQLGVLIDELLQFSSTSRKEIHQNILDMNMLFQEAFKTVTCDLADRDIEWVLSDFPEIWGDVNLLRLVWTNLLTNALKFTGKKDKTRIETGYSEVEDEFIFSIRDNGVGFDMQYAGNLFGVFQRLHAREDFQGTGIGLANVSKIIKKHGGRIWAEAEPGKGAAFYFTIPKHDQAQTLKMNGI